MREVKFIRDISPSKHNKVENFYQDPKEEDHDNYNIKSKLLEIDHLERFNWFGDRNMPPEKEEDEFEPFTVISVIPSEVYLVDRKVFLELLPKEYTIQFKSYPNDYKLRKRYFEQKSWKLYKTEVFKDLTSDPNMKKSALSHIQSGGTEKQAVHLPTIQSNGLTERSLGKPKKSVSIYSKPNTYDAKGERLKQLRAQVQKMLNKSK